MARKLRRAIDYHQPRFMQISESHCGPAVIQMMLSFQGIEVTQEQVAEAGGASSLIALHGMRVDQLAQAVRRLAPDLVFFYKTQSTLAELVRVVQQYRHPVGVEWQGVFEDEAAAALDSGNKNWSPGRKPTAQDQKGLLPDSESEDNDYGHYSLVIRADLRHRQLMVADPYKDFFSQTRIFDFDVFDRRWYDYNEVPDPLTGEARLVEDDHLMFLVARRAVLFPRRMGMHEYPNIQGRD